MKLSRYQKIACGLVAASILLFVWSATIASAGTMTSTETSIFRSVNDLSDSLRPPMLLLTQAGSILFAFVVVGLLFFLGRRYLALKVLFVVVIVRFLIEWAKAVIARPRPITTPPPHIERSIVDLGFGFPSGHTAIATVLALMVVLYMKGKWRWLVLLLIPIVGLSRVYLGMHAPLDIVGGVCVATAVTLLFWIVDKKTTKS